MGKRYDKVLSAYIDMINWNLKVMKETKSLRNLRKNLESGICVNISQELIKLLMEKDWTNG